MVVPRLAHWCGGQLALSGSDKKQYESGLEVADSGIFVRRNNAADFKRSLEDCQNSELLWKSGSQYGGRR